MDHIEHKFICLSEIKFADPGADGTATRSFTGYGAFFGNLDAYGDVIEPGAFQDSITSARKSGNWPAMLSQHGAWGMTSEDLTPIGVWMDMEEDDKGLFMKGKLAPTPRGQELYTLMKMSPRPAINGLSIGYLPIKFKMRGSPDEPRRTLQELKLIEISPVTFPANPKARVQSAKGDDATTIRIAEQALRDVGFSQSEAKAILVAGFKSARSSLRDVAPAPVDDLCAALQRSIDALRA